MQAGKHEARDSHSAGQAIVDPSGASLLGSLGNRRLSCPPNPFLSQSPMFPHLPRYSPAPSTPVESHLLLRLVNLILQSASVSPNAASSRRSLSSPHSPLCSLSIRHSSPFLSFSPPLSLFCFWLQPEFLGKLRFVSF